MVSQLISVLSVYCIMYKYYGDISKYDEGIGRCIPDW